MICCSFGTTPAYAVALSKPQISVLQSISPAKLYFNDDLGTRIDDTPWFLGSHSLGGQYSSLGAGTTLYHSNDLVHWSDPTVIPGTENNYNAGGIELSRVPFNYSRFANSNGDTNSEIDPNDFYVTGTTITSNPFNPSQDARIVNTVHLKLVSLPTSNATPTPTPTTSNKPDDLNHDRVVNIQDYNILVQNYGHPYTVQDYNTHVKNYGK